MKKEKIKWWEGLKLWASSEEQMETRPKNPAESDPKAIGEKRAGGKPFLGIKWSFKW